MTARIDNLDYAKDTGETLFITGPTEFLCLQITEVLKKIPVWQKIFGEFIDPYIRMDYAERNPPVMRVYNKTFVKSFESWFIEGDVVADMIFPASLRRKELQQIPDTICAAMLQQFRSTTFFNDVSNAVPGLNELGKRFEVDKSMAFEWGDALLPLTQITLNFRLDLRVWDEYLTSDNRTKDLPFDRTLGNLERIVSVIKGLRDNSETEVTEGVDQKI